jgi:formate hydrogenlyase subunit 6/NADH:ubiquinone oxidoreductase subunit I
LAIPLPKIRELGEAVRAVFSPRFTTRFPAEPCEVPEKLRGKPEFDLDKCIGCGACVNACPSSVCLTMQDDLEADPPIRRITLNYFTCIFCGNCQDQCTNEGSIKLSKQWDLAGLDRTQMTETHEYELQMCEKCGAKIGTKKHLVWLCEKLGPLAYTNPSLLIAKSGGLLGVKDKEEPAGGGTEAGDFVKILCPTCKCDLNVQL